MTKTDEMRQACAKLFDDYVEGLVTRAELNKKLDEIEDRISNKQTNIKGV